MVEQRARMAVGLALPAAPCPGLVAQSPRMCTGGDCGDSEPESRWPVSANIGPEPLFSH